MRKHRSLFTGIREQNLAQGIKLFPNPASNYCILKSDEIWSGNVNVINSLGQIVKSYTPERVRQITVSTTDLKAGIYMVMICTADGCAQHKLIIQR
jgi:hypothetical protein